MIVKTSDLSFTVSSFKTENYYIFNVLFANGTSFKFSIPIYAGKEKIKAETILKTIISMFIKE